VSEQAAAVVPVRLTHHAAAQLKARCPEYRDASFLDIVADVRRHVQEARASGRIATRCPRQFIRPGTRFRYDARKHGGRPAQGARYAWTDDDDRLYVIIRRRGSLRPGGEKVAVDVVLTAWANPNGRPE
jgi:hypothetical protein